MTEFTAEFIGTMILILLGDGVVANVCLKGTKGHNSGLIVDIEEQGAAGIGNIGGVDAAVG